MFRRDGYGHAVQVAADDELERLRARTRALSGYVALAAHELRAPATVVHGIAATLHARPEELHGENARPLIDLLNAHTTRLVRLLDQLLDLSRLDAEAIPIEPEVVPVRDRIVQLVETVAGPRADDVAIAVPESLRARVDPNALDRILSNLVTNALRHGKAPVRIAAQQTDRHFRLEVEDQGEGVPEELRERLFDRFSRGADDGTGLGLSIAQSYAHAHGGSIFYDRAAAGTRFRLVIPAPPPA